MKQLLQNLKNGTTILEDVPVPQISRGHVLIRTSHSLISLGTERMLVEFGRANLLAKVRQQPERVKQVISKIKADGIMPTVRSVLSKLDDPLPLGYCNAGTVIAAGEDAGDINAGERVVSNGHHAEIVLVPKNLVAKIPENVSSEEAPFAVIGAIALHGLRLAQPTFGETVVVIGLGLVGQLAVQLALAHGCRVIGFDIESHKVDSASRFSAVAFTVNAACDPVKTVLEQTSGIGADAVLITASNKDNTIIKQAASMSRKKGRIILIGVVGCEIDRTVFYQKELSFQVSCSFGPGRYDSQYEEKGLDYPLAYVRWTERRNFEAVLDCMSRKKIAVLPLISDIVNFEDAVCVYGSFSESKSIATILNYKGTSDASPTTPITVGAKAVKGAGPDAPAVALIGAGNFTKSILLPCLLKSGASVKYICSKEGITSTHLAKKYNIPFSTTDFETVIKDGDVKAVIIATRHNLHADMCVRALRAGKHVFIEKPLAIKEQELVSVIEEYQKNDLGIMVGFNRRFSPLIQKLKRFLGTPAPRMNVVITVNAGHIPPDHWTQDRDVGGGRIIGEVCHFIDLFAFLASGPVLEVCASSLETEHGESSDSVSILLKSKNGSNGVINYFTNGSKDFPKEKVEVFARGGVILVDNYRKMQGFGVKGLKKKKLFSQDKGHSEEFAQYIRFLKTGGHAPIPFSEIVNVTRATFAAADSLQKHAWISIG